MRKIFFILGMLLGICIIAFFSIIYIFVNPDQFKPLITTQIEKYTGCQLVIDDHLALSFFPYFGVKANHIQMITPNGFQTPSVQIDIKNAIVQFKLLPLLHGNVETGALQIDQLTLNQQHSPSTIQLNNVQLASSAADQSNTSYLTKLSFNFAESSLPLAGHADFTGSVTIDWNNYYYSINNTIFNVSLTDNNRTLNLTITGDMMLDYIKQTASWKNINANLSDLAISGELHAKNILSNFNVSGKFVLQSSHIKNIFEQINLFREITKNLPVMNDINADINLLVNKQSFDVQSNFHIKNMQMSNINIDDINTRLHLHENILNIESMRASLLGGLLNGEATIRFNSYLPAMTAHVNAYNLQVEQLVNLMRDTNADIHPNSSISGTGNIELNVYATGADKKSILTSLNGTSRVSITNGILMGKEWDDIVTRSVASNNVITQQMISQYLRVLRFKQLSSSFKINNGIFDSDDLLLESADINIKGKGKINLQNNLIDYALQAEFQNVSSDKSINNNSAKTILAAIIIRQPI